MNGGYSLIDFFDVNITSEPVKIEGIFKKYQASKRKAFLLSNVTINNTQFNDVFSTPYFEDGKVCFPAYDGVIKISDTDYVNFDVTADVIADMYLSKEEFLSIESDNTPYVSRTARDGLVKLSLTGATVAWNQLVQNGNFADGTNNWSLSNPSMMSMSVTNNKCIITISEPKDYLNIKQANVSQKVFNHVALMMVTITCAKATSCRFTLGQDFEAMPVSANTRTKLVQIRKITNLQYNQFALLFNVNNQLSSGDSVDLENMQVFDLTQMFGTEIADYIYSLETAEAGSGISWLKSYGFLTKDYYDYDAGSLQSVCTSARKIIDLDGNEKTYPIDDVQLRGLFKLDTNNKLYCDGDIYKSNGAVTRKYGIVDLGTLNWTYRSDDNLMYSSDIDSIIKAPADNAHVGNAVCVNYQIVKRDDQSDKTMSINSSGTICVLDSTYTDAATFKSAMSGVYLVYELATETTFSADPYINPQRSEGTEEFVDGLTRDVMIPMGNESTYYKDELFNIIGEYIDSCDDAVIAMIPEGE